MKIEPKFVRLSVPAVHYALGIATQRDACKHDKNGGVYSRTMSGLGVHFAGVIGEMCFTKVHGGKMDTTVLPDGDNHRPDITMKDGRMVEVKTSLFSGRDVEMKFEDNEYGKADYVSLVQVTLPDAGKVFPIWDWEYVKANMEEKDYGYGARYAFCPNRARKS